jgi:two-component sensor histidine kinase
VQPLATVLHELAANATRHGALSRPEGRLRLSWRLDPAASLFRLDWAESGGPGLDGPPGHQGFGSRALEASVRRQLGGELRQHWLAEGLRCEIALPLELVSDPARAA